MANLVVHFEIHATEPQRLIDFYSGLLGWTFTQFGDMPYWAIDTGERPWPAQTADIRLIEPTFETPPVAEAMFWYTRNSSDPAHRWLRDRLREISAALGSSEGE